MKLRSALVVSMVLLGGCSSTSTTAEPSAGATTSTTGTVTVLAAASLNETFTALAKNFEAAHPGTTVKLSFGASSALAQQVINGAPADVFAAASTSTMKTAQDAGKVKSSTVFATNSMEIAVPKANPGSVHGLSDLSKPGLKVVLCQAQVPCGVSARTVFSKAGITVTPVSLEADVKAVLTKVSTAEADAGVVYVTDVLAAAKTVTGIQIPVAQNSSTSYPIATLTDAPQTALAQAFSDYVRSAEGKSVLTKAGFGAP